MTEQKRHGAGAPASRGGEFAASTKPDFEGQLTAAVDLQKFYHVYQLRERGENCRGPVLISYPDGTEYAVRDGYIHEDGDIVLEGRAEVADEDETLSATQLMSLIDDATDAAENRESPTPTVRLYTEDFTYVKLVRAHTSNNLVLAGAKAPEDIDEATRAARHERFSAYLARELAYAEVSG